MAKPSGPISLADAYGKSKSLKVGTITVGVSGNIWGWTASSDTGSPIGSANPSPLTNNGKTCTGIYFNGSWLYAAFNPESGTADKTIYINGRAYTFSYYILGTYIDKNDVNPFVVGQTYDIYFS